MAEMLSSNFPSKLVKGVAPLTSNFPSKLVWACVTKPPTSLQNWSMQGQEGLQLPFKTGYASCPCLQLPFKTGLNSRGKPPTSLQNWLARSGAFLQLPFKTGLLRTRLSSNFPSKLVAQTCHKPPTSLQNWLLPR